MGFPSLQITKHVMRASLKSIVGLGKNCLVMANARNITDIYGALELHWKESTGIGIIKKVKIMMTFRWHLNIHLPGKKVSSPLDPELFL